MNLGRLSCSAYFCMSDQGMSSLLSFCVDVFVADDSDVAEAFSFISFVDVDILKSVTVRLRDASDDPCVLLLNE